MWKSLFSSTDSRSITWVYYILTSALTLNRVHYHNHLVFMRRRSHLIGNTGQTETYLFIFLLNWLVCFAVVKLAESMLLSTLQIPVKFKRELCVCVWGGVLIYTCILGSLDKLGGVPLTMLRWEINWYLAWCCHYNYYYLPNKAAGSCTLGHHVPSVSSPRMTGNWNQERKTWEACFGLACVYQCVFRGDEWIFGRIILSFTPFVCNTWK